MDQKKKMNSQQMHRFDSVLLSDLVAGDRLHFPKNKVVFEFKYYSEFENGYIYKKDGEAKEKIKKRDFEVIFLRNIKL